jgi:hypothetical protein
MTSTATPHLYIECDIPDGMTLTEWRRSRADRHGRRPRRRIRRLVHRLPSVF